MIILSLDELKVIAEKRHWPFAYFLLLPLSSLLFTCIASIAYYLLPYYYLLLSLFATTCFILKSNLNKSLLHTNIKQIVIKKNFLKFLFSIKMLNLLFDKLKQIINMLSSSINQKLGSVKNNSIIKKIR